MLPYCEHLPTDPTSPRARVRSPFDENVLRVVPVGAA